MWSYIQCSVCKLVRALRLLHAHLYTLLFSSELSFGLAVSVLAACCCDVRTSCFRPSFIYCTLIVLLSQLWLSFRCCLHTDRVARLSVCHSCGAPPGIAFTDTDRAAVTTVHSSCLCYLVYLACCCCSFSATSARLVVHTLCQPRQYN